MSEIKIKWKKKNHKGNAITEPKVITRVRKVMKSLRAYMCANIGNDAKARTAMTSQVKPEPSTPACQVQGRWSRVNALMYTGPYASHTSVQAMRKLKILASSHHLFITLSRKSILIDRIYLFT